MGAFVTVASYRNRTFESRARAEVQDDLRVLAAGGSAALITSRLATTEEPGGPGVIVVTDGEASASIETLQIADIPAELRLRTRENGGELAETTTVANDASMLVVGAFDEATETELYAFFPRTDVDQSLHEMRITLAGAWTIVTVLAAVVGSVVARRTLRPVATAAAAARSVTEGLLDTRLPVSGRDEFGAWAETFNEMVGALEEKLRALAEARDRERRFSADIAHELRTPLGAALTASSHLANGGSRLPPAEIDACASIVVDAMRRLDRLTSELLELHRIESDQDVLDATDVDVVTVVEDLLLAHDWSSAVEIQTIGDDPGVVVADRRRLDRIVTNLIANAVRHGAPPVVVSIRALGPAVHVDVVDHGPGISPEDTTRIFDRHFKGSSHRGYVNGHGGSGLGLSIAVEAARSLGGTIELLPSGQAGAHFRLVLPRGGRSVR